MARDEKTSREKRFDPHAAERQARRHEEEMLDDALDGSFPASDPPAQTAPATAPKIDAKKLTDAAQKAAEHEKASQKKGG